MMLLDDEQMARNNPSISKLDYYTLIDVMTYSGAASVSDVRNAIKLRKFPDEMTRQEKLSAGFLNTRVSRWRKEDVHKWGSTNEKLQTN